MARQNKDWQAAQADRLMALLAAHPGLDAIELKAKGYHPSTHGSLVRAEQGGWIVYRDGGWRLAAAGVR